MRHESSYVNTVKLAKKIYHISRDIEIFLGDYFFGAPCSFYSDTTVLYKFDFIFFWVYV